MLPREGSRNTTLQLLLASVNDLRHTQGVMAALYKELDELQLTDNRDSIESHDASIETRVTYLEQIVNVFARFFQSSPPVLQIPEQSRIESIAEKKTEVSPTSSDDGFVKIATNPFGTFSPQSKKLETQAASEPAQNIRLSL